MGNDSSYRIERIAFYPFGYAYKKGTISVGGIIDGSRNDSPSIANYGWMF